MKDARVQTVMRTGVASLLFTLVLVLAGCSSSGSETIWGSGRAGGSVKRDTIKVGIGTVTVGSGGSGTSGTGSGRGYGAGSGAGNPTDDQAGVVRYPTIEAPPSVRAGTDFSVVVSLTMDELTPEVRVQLGDTTAEGALKLDLPDEADEWPIDVTLSASGFAFRDGKNAARIVLPRNGDSTPALFQLSAVPFDGEQRSTKLLATFWYNGGYLARVVRDVVVQNEPPSAAGDAGSAGLGALPGAAVPSVRAASAAANRMAGSEDEVAPTSSSRSVLSFDRKQPDLTLLVMHGLAQDQPGSGTIIIESPYLTPKPYPIERTHDLEGWLSEQYEQFAQMSSRGASASGAGGRRETARYLMTGFGRQLYEMTPEAFKDAYWKLVDRLGDEFDTIQIYTDDPAFPWELVKPVRQDGSEERDFIGLEFAVGRWHMAHSGRQMERPPQTLEVESLVVFAPEYTGRLQLPGQAEEIAMLETFTGYKRWPSRFELLPRLFRQLPDGIIHFSGHGVVERREGEPPRSAILLEDGELDLLAWKGMTSRRPRSHPFFFFNACEVGQSEAVASFVDGWAPAVLDAGASGYVGALWPIGDTGAARFATHFYSTLEERLAGGPVSAADLLRESRRLFIDEADPTYLAYVFYGDPSLEFLPR